MTNIYSILAIVAIGRTHSSKITIQVKYPKLLSSMYIRGSSCGLNWNSGLKMNANVVSSQSDYSWTYDIDCKEATDCEIKVLVNDKDWMLGSNHHIPSTLFQDDTNSSMSNTDTFFPWFYTTKGSLYTIHDVYSSELKNKRDIIFYLPPSYNENTLKHYENILIMHDGQNLFDPRTSAFGTAWMCQNTLDQLIIEGNADEVVIAGAYNTPDRIDEYTYVYDSSEEAGGLGDLYLDWIESTLIPLASTQFRLIVDRDRLGILGSSLGGLISCYAGWTRADIYGKVGCMSSSFWWDNRDFQVNVVTSQSPIGDNSSLSLPALYMDAGTGSQGERQCARYTTEILEYCVSSVGYVDGKSIMEYIAEGATHDEASWGERFHVPIQFLYPSSTV